VRKALTIAVLLASLLHQGFVKGAQVMHRDAEGLAHGILHWEKAAHHHHDDGSFHQEQTEESASHVLADVVLGAAALTSAPCLVPLHPRCQMLAPSLAIRLAAPCLDGPRRPPRLSS
jgi:hypothetical protein